MFCFRTPGSVSEITAGKCPDVSLKVSSGFMLTNAEAPSQAVVSGLTLTLMYDVIRVLCVWRKN